MFKLTGVIKVIGETVQVSEKFSKREVVITDASSMYPQDILFQFAQDKCDLVDSHNVGENVEVSFNIRGRLWTSPQGEDKYFNTLDAWRIEKISTGSMPPPASAPEAPAPVATEGDDDLPF